MQDRLLTTHVGSLIRPPELVELLRKRAGGGDVDEGTVTRVLDAAVADVVRKQADIGLDIVNDGEFGKNIS